MANTEAALLTVSQIQNALAECPNHRADTRKDLQLLLRSVRRGIPVKITAPAWFEAQNVIYVNKVDKGSDEVDA